MTSNLKIVFTGADVFVLMKGVKIAKRGYPDTPQAGTWIAMEPGYSVSGGIEDDLVIEYSDDRVTRQ
jgi:hypothetical protein